MRSPAGCLWPPWSSSSAVAERFDVLVDYFHPQGALAERFDVLDSGLTSLQFHPQGALAERNDVFDSGPTFVQFHPQGALAERFNVLDLGLTLFVYFRSPSGSFIFPPGEFHFFLACVAFFRKMG